MDTTAFPNLTSLDNSPPSFPHLKCTYVGHMQFLPGFQLCSAYPLGIVKLTRLVKPEIQRDRDVKRCIMLCFTNYRTPQDLQNLSPRVDQGMHTYLHYIMGFR